MAHLSEGEGRVLVTQSRPTLRPHGLDSPPGSSGLGILQARTLGWVAIPFSRGFSQPSNRTQVSHIAGRFFTIWATQEALQLSTVFQDSWEQPEAHWLTFSHAQVNQILIRVHQLQDWAHTDSLSPVPTGGVGITSPGGSATCKETNDNRWQLRRPHSKSRQGVEKGHPGEKKKKLYNTWKSVQATGYGLSTTAAEVQHKPGNQLTHLS